MESWLYVIHGAKGIAWFPYFDMAKSGRWAAMKKFADQIKVLTPVVLQPETVYKVADNTNTALNRVVTLILEHDGNIYVIAARVTEPDPVPKFKYQGIEPDSIEFNFQVSNLTEKAVAGLYMKEGLYP